jgi:hypothetical protein
MGGRLDAGQLGAVSLAHLILYFDLYVSVVMMSGATEFPKRIGEGLNHVSVNYSFINTEDERDKGA